MKAADCTAGLAASEERRAEVPNRNEVAIVKMCGVKRMEREKERKREEEGEKRRRRK